MSKLLQEMHASWIGMTPRPLTPEHKKLVAAMVQAEARLLKKLSGKKKAKAMFEEFVSTSGELHYAESQEAFTHGIATGALLMQEILETKAGIFGE